MLLIVVNETVVDERLPFDSGEINFCLFGTIELFPLFVEKRSRYLLLVTPTMELYHCKLHCNISNHP